VNSVIDGISMQTLRAEYLQADVSSLPSDHTTGWRTLPFFMYSQAETGSEQIRLENGSQWRADPGELLVLPAGTRHKVDVVSDAETRQWAHVNYFLLDNVDLFNFLEVPVLVKNDIGVETGGVIREWVQSQTQYQGNPLLLAVKQHEFALRLLALLIPACRWKSDAQEKLDGLRRLNPVIQYMQQHLGESMNRNDLARMCGLSPAQFHVVFSAIMHSTPMDYLRKIRLRHAQRLLIMTSDPVQEVGILSGYEDPFVFCKFFKRACGLSPSEYRNRNRFQ
jgi:AraC-like DNA-binding protein